MASDRLKPGICAWANPVNSKLRVNDARKLKDRPDAPKAAFSRLGILGAGTMGAGIAQVAAEGGLEVVLLDQSVEAAEAAVERIAKGLNRLIEKGIVSQGKRDSILSRSRLPGD